MSGPAAIDGHGPRRGVPPRAVIGMLADEETRSALSEAARSRGIPFAFELGDIEAALAGLHPDEMADCVIVDLDGTPDAVDDVAVLSIGLPRHAELILLGIFTEEQISELAQAGARLCLSKPLSEAALTRILGPVPVQQRPAPQPEAAPPPAPYAVPTLAPAMPAPVAMEATPLPVYEMPAEPQLQLAAFEAPAEQPERSHRAYAVEAEPTPARTQAQRFAEPPPSYGAPPQPRAALTQGRVLSIVGCRGGVGASTAAVGLAWLLAEDMGHNTVLLDLDPYFGSVALALNLEPGDALQQALERPTRIDKVFLDRAVRKVGQNLFVLSSEQMLDKPTKLDPAGPAALVRSLAGRHQRVIVDLPRNDPEIMTRVLALSDEIILVTDLSLAGARDAMRLMALARAATVYARIRIVGGGGRDSGKSPILSPSEFRRAVGTPIDIAIAHDSETASDAARSGRPMPKVFPRSPASKALRNLAQSLESNEQREPKRKLLFWKK